ncbi:hypothetical protein BJF79_33460 [Actinomadura sp. CNU-125]|uniref:DUF4037 domain-containing protein n=1 Tax=Actinomadura sp. CNU-125 TaxID=1904961 RepID=UPI0009598A9C|nr:DUF4037 domain-containing protein [Actinomadura sp. CNU-125]OLT34344.1 hypothetical protein BJF79_33460 [Actinomadura sp. CNU-125]
MNDVRGAELAGAFYADLVRPLLDARFPGLPHAAARLGSGSDVLGFDDATSRDHDWGCRLTLLLDDADAVPDVRAVLERELPGRYGEHPVRFPVTWDPAATHNVEVATVAGFCRSRLGVDPTRDLSAVDWLCLTGQSVLEVTAGPVFADGTATLSGARATLDRYPPDVERYVVASWWRRASQWMPVIGRTATRGDETGSRVLAARVAEDLLRLAFVLSGRWTPYAKWRGTAFRGLPVAGDLAPALDAAVTAPAWQDREAALADAAETLLGLQRRRGLHAPPAATVAFWDRPYRTVDDAIAEGLLADVRDPEVAALPRHVGSIEQWVDGVDVLMDPARRAALRGACRAWLRP